MIGILISLGQFRNELLALGVDALQLPLQTWQTLPLGVGRTTGLDLLETTKKILSDIASNDDLCRLLRQLPIQTFSALSVQCLDRLADCNRPRLLNGVEVMPRGVDA
jgi:hypothetical protein